MLLVSQKLRFENCDFRSDPACAKLVPKVNRERDGKPQLCKVPALVGGDPEDRARYQSLYGASLNIIVILMKGEML